ncbi:MAG: MFS transporter [Candidatus Lokiarchaeota archaeon]|nr:MFS transporter [Candidatus Lokiarchaeota archaeon]MBD3339899.1 MFS transporter [Candidatus Lokiarchaeota archaeon]
MGQTNKDYSGERSKKALLYMIVVLMFVEILDTYCTLYPTVIPSKVIAEFLVNNPENVAHSIYALCVAIASIGTYFVLLNQYLADRKGRKILLAITVFGMGFSSLLIATATNIVQYTIYLFMLYIFFSSDIWTIYISEECPPDKRGKWNTFVLMGGMIGALLLPTFRSIFITETMANWRGMTYFPIVLGLSLSLIILITFKETQKFKEMRIRRATCEEKPKFIENMKLLFNSTRRKELIVILLVGLIAGLNTVFFRLIEAYWASSGHVNEAEINLLIYIIAVSVILGYLITGIIADKWGRKPLLYVYSIMFPIVIIIVVLGVNLSGLTLLIVVGTSVGMAYIIGQGITIIARLITVEITPTDARGTGSGLRSLIAAVGMTIGLFISSGLILFFGLGLTFIILSLPHLIIVPLTYLFLKETKGINLSDIT